MARPDMMFRAFQRWVSIMREFVGEIILAVIAVIVVWGVVKWGLHKIISDAQHAAPPAMVTTP
jgi:hypothetical protein